MLDGPAVRVARSRLPQVVLEAHLPGFFPSAAAAEPPQAAGRAPQQPAALAGERGQVVHAAVATVLRATTPARPSLPSRGRGAGVGQRLGSSRPAARGPGLLGARGGPSGPARRGVCVCVGVGGEGEHEVPEKFCSSLPRPAAGRHAPSRVCLSPPWTDPRLATSWGFKSPAPVLDALPPLPVPPRWSSPLPTSRPAPPRPAWSRPVPDAACRTFWTATEGRTP